MFQHSLAERTVPVPVSVPGKRFRRFRFRVRFLTVPVSGSGSVPGPPFFSLEIRGFEKGLAGVCWRLTGPNTQQQKAPQNSVPLLLILLRGR